MTLIWVRKTPSLWDARTPAWGRVNGTTPQIWGTPGWRGLNFREVFQQTALRLGIGMWNKVFDRGFCGFGGFGHLSRLDTTCIPGLDGGPGWGEGGRYLPEPPWESGSASRQECCWALPVLPIWGLGAGGMRSEQKKKKIIQGWPVTAERCFSGGQNPKIKCRRLFIYRPQKYSKTPRPDVEAEPIQPGNQAPCFFNQLWELASGKKLSRQGAAFAFVEEKIQAWLLFLEDFLEFPGGNFHKFLKPAEESLRR